MGTYVWLDMPTRAATVNNPAKAEEAARTVVRVDARFSSQECSRYGHVARESRRRRRYVCVACGFACHADVNAELIPAEDAGRRTRRTLWRYAPVRSIGRQFSLVKRDSVQL